MVAEPAPWRPSVGDLVYVGPVEPARPQVRLNLRDPLLPDAPPVTDGAEGYATVLAIDWDVALVAHKDGRVIPGVRVSRIVRAP